MIVPHGERLLLLDGLKKLMNEKENEIYFIQQKTEEDFKAAKRVSKFSNEPFSLEKAKEREITRVQKEIEKIETLYERINGGENHVLFVPKMIKLVLKEEK